VFGTWIFAVLFFIAASASAQSTAEYCVPVFSLGNYITVKSVLLGTLNNPTGQNAADYTSYVSAPTSVQTTELAQSSQHTITINLEGTNYDNSVAAWIDYNRDGDFNDAGEQLGSAGGQQNGANAAFSFSVPATAMTGATRLRVRASGYNVPNPCSNYYYYGETEDYPVTIVAPAPCTGTPALGHGVYNAGLVCPATNFYLSVSSYPAASSGVAYQWEVSTTDASGPYTVLTGQNNVTAIVGGQEQSSWYRLRATCTGSGESVVSTAVKVAQQADANCYCVPIYTGGNYAGYIEAVQLGTINNVTGRNDADFTSYASAPAPNQTTELAQGSPQRLTFSVGAASGGVGNPTIFANVWIDYNADGDFEDAGEFIGNSNIPSNGVRFSAITFTVPAGAVPGATRLRIRTSVNHDDGEGPCGHLQNGEAEDYPVTIVVPTPCTGTPAVGSALSSNAGPVCSGTSFNLSVSPYPGPASVAYQWEVSTAGPSGPFTAISGQTYTTATITGQLQNSWYRLRATCGNSGTTSAAVNVTQQPDITACYCVPNLAYSSGYRKYYINAVQLGTINNTTGQNTSSYTSYVSAPTATQTTDLILGSQQSITITGAYDHYVSAFIDFNKDGDFTDPGERIVYSFLNYTDHLTFTFTVPATAVPGATRMRVSGGSYELFDPCFQQGQGENEDYLVNIVTPCSIQPVTTSISASGPSTFCKGGSVTLTAGGADSYLWSTGATTASITVADAGTYSVTGTNTIGCSNTSAPITVTTGTPANAGTAGNLTICSGTPLTNARLFAALGGSPAAGGTWSPVLAGADTYTYTVAATAPCTGNATATVTVSTVNRTINAGCFRATIARTYNPAANTTTFTYNVCANGCLSSLGYIAFITQTNIRVVAPLHGTTYKTAKYAYKVSVPVGVDAKGRMIYGIKYDVTTKGGGIKNKGECDNFTFTLAGNVAEDAILVQFKTGTEVINATADCPASSSITGATITSARVAGEQILEVPAKLNVSSYPNPYTDKVKFVIQSPVSGPASLEVFNMLGQKVQTVFQGYVEAGSGKSLEYDVPVANRGNLIYILRVGDQQATGKLIH
jgi:hypothetical protein